MTKVRFPKISDEQLLQMLEPPKGPVRMVLDTDTQNEIDDQFALAWALLSPEQVTLEAVYAEPFTFQHRLRELRHVYDLRLHPERITEADYPLMKSYTNQLDGVLALGLNPHEMQMVGPAEGMEGSYQEILTVFEKLGMDPSGRVFRGSPAYLTSLDQPLRTPAAEDLVQRAMASSADDPLYVSAIGCLTNLASAMLMEPEIITRMVVLWTAGFPTHLGLVNPSLNMEQDMLASQILFDSGVPLVYLPGFHIGAQLRLSLPEMEAWVKGKGAIGDYLYHLYTHNPLYPFLGLNDYFGRTWVIWDIINIAWLLQPDWVPTYLTQSPVLTDDKRWVQADGRHLIREAYEIDRDAIFRDFFAKLEKAAP